MWANAQRDGRLAEYRWCPLYAAKTRNPLKLAGVPQTNETISSAASRPKFTMHCKDMWGDIAVLQVLSPIVDTCLSCEEIARQSCALTAEELRSGVFEPPFGDLWER